jgi:hypothetical protein
MTSASNCGNAASRGRGGIRSLSLIALLLTVACDRQEKSPPPLEAVVKAMIIPMEPQNPLRDVLDAWADGQHDQALDAFLELVRVPLDDLPLTSIDPESVGTRTTGERNDFEPVFRARRTALKQLGDELIKRAHAARAAGDEEYVSVAVAALVHVLDANDAESGRETVLPTVVALRKRLDTLRAEPTTTE